ncbi:ras guanine nucleotide exchange factor domain-containing protein [Rhodocollybia butyracea]|uniref:Ras guanine nucleotide exchange factor domain-containing protein n=1 Tax=Rhodocollybia butyracea TaxID=206335 RepID=A0A9P5PS66_9AGAR|nr:ras guanine nucleotide exchange factor domain-containing protein [Rhodocollybia butyracea]
MAQPLDDVLSPTQAIFVPATDNLLTTSPLPTVSPTASFVSKESYATAVSSPSSDLEETIKPTSPTLVSPQSLRKSISVDSFVHYGRDALSPVVTRPNRGHTGSALEPPTGLVGLRRDLNHVNQLGRSRGDSVSSVKSSLAGDSDPDAFSNTTDRFKNSPLKAQDPARSFAGGELPLPSRTPALSTTSSMSSIMSNSSTQEAAPPLRSASSLPARPLVSAGRTRSGSLGVYSQNTRRMQINTQVNSQEQNQAITIAVVGTAGCGKSVAIRKGLKYHNLSEPSGPLPGTHPSTRHTRRTGIYVRDEGVECPLYVIEVDVTPEMLQSPISPLNYLPEALKIDGVIVCYDASNEASFTPVEELLKAYIALQLPVIVIACKSDLERKVDPLQASETLQQYDVGLVEVNDSENGKGKMRRSFDYLLKAVLRERRNGGNRLSEDYRNPASPEIVTTSPSWDRLDGSRTVTPTASSASSLNHVPIPAPISIQSSLPTIPASRTTSVPNSPTRARSTGDLLGDQREERSRYFDEVIQPTIDTNIVATNGSRPPEVDHSPATELLPPAKAESKEMRPAQWATLDELLDKLLFLSVSGDDPTFITHFLLTYRRFASPRNLLLAMQKRMRQLDNPSGDPMFACFAQMKICHLLELWIRDYSYDFAVRGTAGALSALIKSIISKTYLLHYGSDFLPFLEVLPTLVDRDSAWALKVDDHSAYLSDDSYSLLEDDDDESVKSSVNTTSSPPGEQGKTSMTIPSRSRKSSLPLLTAKVLFPSSGSSNGSVESDNTDFTVKQQLRELVKLANEVNMMDPGDIAQEITRIEKRLFLEIEPRHWLHFTFVSGKKDPELNTIARFNNVSNHLADWVVSLILCHDRPRDRAKQIEKFVDVAHKLRGLNNYSALRAFVAGINNSTFAGDQTMEKFKQRSPEQAKALQSWDVLLQAIRAHRAYRLALRNTKGACIPALEVHMSDLIRAHEANDDTKSGDPTKIHWGKFNMMGRFITSTTQCQAQCRSTTDYNFPERPHIGNVLLTKYLMNDEMQKSRIAPPDNDFDDIPVTTNVSQIKPPRDMTWLRSILNRL